MLIEPGEGYGYVWDVNLGPAVEGTWREDTEVRDGIMYGPRRVPVSPPLSPPVLEKFGGDTGLPISPSQWEFDMAPIRTNDQGETYTWVVDIMSPNKEWIPRVLNSQGNWDAPNADQLTRIDSPNVAEWDQLYRRTQPDVTPYVPLPEPIPGSRGSYENPWQNIVRQEGDYVFESDGQGGEIAYYVAPGTTGGFPSVTIKLSDLASNKNTGTKVQKGPTTTLSFPSENFIPDDRRKKRAYDWWDATKQKWMRTRSDGASSTKEWNPKVQRMLNKKYFADNKVSVSPASHPIYAEGELSSDFVSGGSLPGKPLDKDLYQGYVPSEWDAGNGLIKATTSSTQTIWNKDLGKWERTGPTPAGKDENGNYIWNKTYIDPKDRPEWDIFIPKENGVETEFKIPVIDHNSFGGEIELKTPHTHSVLKPSENTSPIYIHPDQPGLSSVELAAVTAMQNTPNKIVSGGELGYKTPSIMWITPEQKHAEAELAKLIPLAPGVSTSSPKVTYSPLMSPLVVTEVNPNGAWVSAQSDQGNGSMTMIERNLTPEASGNYKIGDIVTPIAKSSSLRAMSQGVIGFQHRRKMINEVKNHRTRKNITG